MKSPRHKPGAVAARPLWLFEKLQIFCVPAHGGVDAVAPARVVEEDLLLYPPRIHLAILPQVDRGLRKAVGLAAGIQAVLVGFVFVGPRLGIQHRRELVVRTS